MQNFVKLTELIKNIGIMSDKSGTVDLWSAFFGFAPETIKDEALERLTKMLSKTPKSEAEEPHITAASNTAERSPEKPKEALPPNPRPAPAQAEQGRAPYAIYIENAHPKLRKDAETYIPKMADALEDFANGEKARVMYLAPDTKEKHNVFAGLGDGVQAWLKDEQNRAEALEAYAKFTAQGGGFGQTGHRKFKRWLKEQAKD